MEVAEAAGVEAANTKNSNCLKVVLAKCVQGRTLLTPCKTESSPKEPADLSQGANGSEVVAAPDIDVPSAPVGVLNIKSLICLEKVVVNKLLGGIWREGGLTTHTSAGTSQELSNRICKIPIQVWLQLSSGPTCHPNQAHHEEHVSALDNAGNVLGKSTTSTMFSKHPQQPLMRNIPMLCTMYKIPGVCESAWRKGTGFIKNEASM
jgi:hypothetical protein